MSSLRRISFLSTRDRDISSRVTFTTQSTGKSSRSVVTKSQSRPFTYVACGDFSIVWLNVAVFIVGHVCWAHALYLLITQQIKWLTFGYCFWITNWAGIGVSTGAHRLWAHKSFHAEWPLKMFLLIGQLIAGQNCLYIWCRDHRVHHKYSDSDADPHNCKRGYFFAHVGWLLRRKHPEVKSKSHAVDMSDLLSDPLVRFQTQHYWLLYFFIAFAIPIVIPVYAWSETWLNSLFISYFLRYLTSLHCTWFVNSTAHMFGDRPYNLNISPVDNHFVSFCTFGEGYHNYHHTFPMDYATSELPYTLNVSRHFIEFCHRIGLANNLKRPSDAVICARKQNVVDARAKIESNKCCFNSSQLDSGYEADEEDQGDIIYNIDSKSL